MRKHLILGIAGAMAVFAIASPASAQEYNPFVSSYQNNQSVQYGLNLPHVPIPNGSDEVRAADGTVCKSSMASNNAYLDMGAIGSNGNDGVFGQASVYARVVMPLGKKPRRLDCTSLYKLEIARLQHEIQMVRMGMGANPAAAALQSSGNVNDDPWLAEQPNTNPVPAAAPKPAAKSAPKKKKKAKSASADGASAAKLSSWSSTGQPASPPARKKGGNWMTDGWGRSGWQGNN